MFKKALYGLLCLILITTPSVPALSSSGDVADEENTEIIKDVTLGEILQEAADIAEQEAAEQEATEQEAAEQEATEQETAEQEAAEQEAAEQEAVEQETAEQEVVEQEVVEQEAAEQEVVEQQAADIEQEVEEQEGGEEFLQENGGVAKSGDIIEASDPLFDNEETETVIEEETYYERERGDDTEGPIEDYVIDQTVYEGGSTSGGNEDSFATGGVLTGEDGGTEYRRVTTSSVFGVSLFTGGVITGGNMVTPVAIFTGGTTGVALDTSLLSGAAILFGSGDPSGDETYSVGDTLYETDTLVGEKPELFQPTETLQVGKKRLLKTDSVTSVEGPIGMSPYRCSLMARHNLMRLTGKSFESGIVPDQTNIAAGDAIHLIHQGQQNDSLEEVLVSEIERNLEKKYRMTQSSIFDLFVYLPNQTGIFAGHRFVAYRAADDSIYVLDSLRGEKTGDSQMIGNYLASYDESAVFFINKTMYQTDKNIRGDIQRGNDLVIVDDLLVEEISFIARLPLKINKPLASGREVITLVNNQVITEDAKNKKDLSNNQVVQQKGRKNGKGAEESIEYLVPRSDKEGISSAYFLSGTTVTSAEEKRISNKDLELENVLVSRRELLDVEVLQQVELGPVDDHLIFSHPVQLDIAVNPGLNGQEVDVFVHHFGDEKYTRSGLTTDPDTVCNPDGTVDVPSSRVVAVDGKVSLFTCGASSFVVTYIGGANAANFVDNSSSDKTITVTTGDVGTGTSIVNMTVTVDSHSIDGEDRNNPGAGFSYASEGSFDLESPDGTIVSLLTTSTYTDPNAPRVLVTFDDAAGSAPSGVPADGTFTPAGGLSDFDGEDPLGDRIFTFTDNVGQDGLFLFSVSLNIETSLCGEGILETGESCDDGNVANGDGCSDICAVESNYECSPQGSGSVCTSCLDDLMVGYLAENVTGTRQTITIADITDHTYDATPIILATPNSQSNNDNYPIPRIRNVTTTSFEISICLDDGNTTCGTASPEDVGLFIVDTDKASCAENFAVGTTTVTTAGANTAFTYGQTFTNIPYVFTTPQQDAQGGNIAAVGWVDDLTVNGANIIGCVHQGIADACTTGQPSESIGRVALDPTLFTMDGFDTGFADISNSDWTNMTFTPTYTDIPVVMVTQNDDDGNQDTQYPRARNITTAGGQFRYCEQDAANVCHTHTSEFVRRFSLPSIEPPVLTGDMCITAPSAFVFSGSYQTQNYEQIIEQQFVDSFTISDTLGSNTGFYTTLQITSLSGATEVISNTNIERKSSGPDYISGDVNTSVTLHRVKKQQQLK